MMNAVNFFVEELVCVNQAVKEIEVEVIDNEQDQYFQRYHSWKRYAQPKEAIINEHIVKIIQTDTVEGCNSNQVTKDQWQSRKVTPFLPGFVLDSMITPHAF